MKYFFQIVLSLIPTILGAITIVFLVIHFVPGDPVSVMLGEFAAPEAEAQLRSDLGLDRPLIVQFGDYLLHLASGDLGRSIRLGTPVIEQIIDRLPYTIALTTFASAISLMVGMPLGIIAAVRRKTAADYVTRSVALIAVSMPTFWLGLLMILLFSIQLGWFPVLGSSASTVGEFLHRAVLPSAALGTVMAALIARVTRASMLEVLNQDYVRTARAKGLQESIVHYRHALKNALLPIITIVGLNVGQLLGGAVITESVFSWPGLGKLFIDSMYARDYPMIQGVALFFAIGVITVNLVTDLIYGIVNPVMRHG